MVIRNLPYNNHKSEFLLNNEQKKPAIIFYDSRLFKISL